MKNIFQLQKINRSEKVIFVPSEFTKGNRVSFGFIQEEAQILESKHDSQKIFISKPLWESLHIPDLPLRLHAFLHEEVLHLGPIIGIFTAGFTKYPNNPIGNRSFYFAKMCKLYEKAGVLPVIFGIQHIQWENGLITGYFFNKNNWQEITVPLPHVVYDRIPNRQVENLQAIQEFKTKFLKEYAIPWFNPGFFNKWDVYQKLTRNKEIAKLSPETILFTNQVDLQTMLIKYDHLYIKAIGGSSGNEVYQITKVDDGYFCRYHDELFENKERKFSSQRSLEKFLLTKIRKNTFIIQQGIPLLKIDNNFFDFRIHTNKDRKGQWQVSAIAGKIADDHHATTHVASGGLVKTLAEMYPDKSKQELIKNKLVNAALVISKELEKQYEGMIAEIGLDMGLDQNDRVWLFDVNAKPGRIIYNHPKLKKLEIRNQLLIFSFSTYLMEQQIFNLEKIYKNIKVFF